MQEIIHRAQWGLPHREDDPKTWLSFGLHETMPSGLQSYPLGSLAWVLLYFHDTVTVRFKENLWTLKPNTLFIWPPATVQIYGCEERDWCHSWLHLCPKTQGHLLTQYGIPSLTPWEVPQGEEAFVHLIEGLHRECSLWENPHSTVLNHTLEMGLIDLVRLRQPHRRADPALLRVKNSIDLNPCQSPHLADLARVAKLSSSHFSARFRESFGEAPLQYLTRKKIERAMHLLQTRPLRISECASILGYQDPFHFSRMFKREVGLSPSQWRFQQLQIHK